MPWAYRILGLFLLGICTVGTILIKDRIPISYRKNQPVKSPIQLSMFKMVNFDIWLIGSVISVMGYLPPVFYLPSKSEKYCFLLKLLIALLPMTYMRGVFSVWLEYAANIGVNKTDASNLLSILSASNAVFRIILGFGADKIGRLNMFIIVSALSGTFSFVIWPFADSYNTLLVYCILWGATSGMYYALVSPHRSFCLFVSFCYICYLL